MWVTNLDRGTVLRIPVRRDGRAGAVRIRATGLAGIDDFAFTSRGDRILAAFDGSSEVALVRPDGTHPIVLTAADGLQNPTSVALRRDTVHVGGAAYVTGEDLRRTPCEVRTSSPASRGRMAAVHAKAGAWRT
ncbi:hypothetical protein [Streptomyces sp. NPDC088261]|uniref:hypothetical protein n=1 Tax=Streptomyces sp. NPDC088261 TaxID=3365851 RepID=UPI0037FA272D